jgi:lipopolysaccharide exporter
VSIGRTAARGVAWNMLFGISSRLLTLVGTLVLTRLIAPDDYGAVLGASIAVTTIAVFTSFAFGQYLIAKDAPPAVAFQAAVIHTGMGVLGMAALLPFAGPIGAVLDTPDLERFVLPYAIAHVIDRARYVPERLLMRALRFRTIASINALGEVVFTAVALGLASRLGADAIVVAVLVRAVLTAALYFRAAPRAEWLVPSRLRGAVVRGLFGYGWPITIGAIADRAATRWDNFIISRLFGPAYMARYNLAYSLAEMPVSHVAEHIGEVLMPSYAKMTERQRRDAVVRAAALLALVVSPLGVGLGAISPTLTDAFFDAQWRGLGPLLTVLCVMTVFRPMTWSVSAYLQAVQRTRPIMISSFARAALVLPLVAIFGAAGGPVWACVGACVGYAVHSVGMIVICGRLVDIPVLPYLAGVFRPLLACVPMFGAVVGVEAALAEVGAPAGVSLLVQVVAGGVAYVAAAFVLVRPTSRELVRLAREVLRRRKPVAVVVTGPPDPGASPS